MPDYKWDARCDAYEAQLFGLIKENKKILGIWEPVDEGAFPRFYFSKPITAGTQNWRSRLDRELEALGWREISNPDADDIAITLVPTDLSFDDIYERLAHLYAAGDHLAFKPIVNSGGTPINCKI